MAKGHYRRIGLLALCAGLFSLSAWAQSALLAPDQQAVDTLLQAQYPQIVDASGQFQPEQLMPRALFYQWLYQAAHLRNPFVSQYAYYRDVPVTHPAYRQIEAFRTQYPLFLQTPGSFQPEAPLLRREAAYLYGVTMDASLLRLTPEEVTRILIRATAEVDQVEAAQSLSIAKCLYTSCLTPFSDAQLAQGKLSYHLEQPLTRLQAVRLIASRLQLDQWQLEQPNVSDKPLLPAGIQTVLSPTSALSYQRLSAGQAVYFYLVRPVDFDENPDGQGAVLPQDSRFHANVVALGGGQAQVSFDQVILPSGDRLRVQGELTLVFPTKKNEDSFIVPGTQFGFQTE
jgi:hypothetical protein